MPDLYAGGTEGDTGHLASLEAVRGEKMGAGISEVQGSQQSKEGYQKGLG